MCDMSEKREQFKTFKKRGSNSRHFKKGGQFKTYKKRGNNSKHTFV
jgi:hypothetical protein